MFWEDRTTIINVHFENAWSFSNYDTIAQPNVEWAEA